MGIINYLRIMDLWDEIDRLDEKVDFLLRKVKALEMRMRKHGIK